MCGKTFHISRRKAKYRILLHIMLHYRPKLAARFPILKHFKCARASKLNGVTCPVCNKTLLQSTMAQHLVMIHKGLSGIWPDEIQKLINNSPDK